MLSVKTSLNEADAAPTSESERDIHYPASLGQQRFWVLDRLDPGNPSLNVAVRWRLEGELPVGYIERAFEMILCRHETLRTCFADVDGEPIQVVRPFAPLRIASLDLTVLPEADAIAECDRIAHAEARTPFNLAIAPLIRVTHVRVRNEVGILLVTSHHAVCDGWSIGLLAREMGEICEAMQSGREPRLEELPVSYGEFSSWQREFIANGGLADDVAFWSKTLNGIGYFELPTDHPRGSLPTSSGSIQSVLLERGITDALKALARRHACTMFMTALAGLVTLLHRYTDASDIVVGTQVAGRGSVEIESLVGLFINTLVLRTDLSGDPRFTELMARARGVVADALDHEAMPLEKVIETLKLKRFPGHNAVFSVNFIFQRSFIRNTDHGKFRLVDLPSYSAGAMYDLNFFMVERPEGWRASCEFNTSLFDEATVRRLLGHFCSILTEVAKDPSRRISEIPLLSEAERAHLITACNRTAADYPQQLTLPQLVDQQAARTPAAIAVVDDGRALSYEAVERRSNALASALLEQGIGPGARVGVFVRRNADLVIAPLAIMKSGNAYVPLDPAYPAGRLTQIIEQSDLSGIVAQRGALPSLPAKSVPVVIVDDAAVSGGVQALPSIDPEDPAYVIFTSGSTGRPKGVQIPHRALANFIWSMRRKPGFTAQDTIIAVTTLCFDIAGLELFLPLAVGAKIVVADEDTTRDGRLLLSLLRRSRATVLQATPATWRMLIEAGWDGDPQLRMLCGGEAMPRELANRLLALSPELWNMYGPTETTIWSSVQRIGAGDGPIPLGPPIANTQFYVVDRHNELVAQGAVGELLIGGDGVGTGYLGMPEATQQRFLPDRFRNVPGATLYRTGDLVRMRHDGALEFLGRADDQVKIRGFRIELGEIESALLRHPHVRHAVVVVRDGPTGEPALYAFIESVGAEVAGRDRIVGELRTQLAQNLPGYMRPSAILVLDALPRLPNGKIDRRALPRRPVATEAAAGPTRPQPLNEVESRLKEMWCSVLGLETIDDDADFFDLGGHSLLAARLLARIETTFGRRINLSALFDSPCFSAFAKLVQSTDRRDFDFRQIVRLQPHGTKKGIFAINNTGIYLTLSRHLGENLPVTALQLFDPSFSRGPLPGSIEEIAERYVELVRQLQREGPYVLLGWCNGGVLAFEIARQLQAAGQDVSRVIVIDTWVPGYLKNLSWLRRKLADYSYRVKLVANDWADVREGRKTVQQFLADRHIFRKLLRPRDVAGPAVDQTYVAAENYDRWLVDYLHRLLQSYHPKPFTGRMTVFRSSREPAGWFLDRELGWDGLATGGVELIALPGDHYSVLQEPGISMMAQCIEQAVAAEVNERPMLPQESVP